MNTVAVPFNPFIIQRLNPCNTLLQRPNNSEKREPEINAHEHEKIKADISKQAGRNTPKKENHKLYIKKMVSERCKMAVKEELKKLGVHYIFVNLGEVEIMETLTVYQHDKLKEDLHSIGLELMDDKRSVLLEKIKNVIREMIHYAEELPKVKYSVYIGEKLHYDYTYLSNIFSEANGISIQQYIIFNKIEYIKELLLYGELNIAEIAYKLHYSSEAHLCNQFKKITGLTPTFFKTLKHKTRSALENV